MQTCIGDDECPSGASTSVILCDCKRKRSDSQNCGPYGNPVSAPSLLTGAPTLDNEHSENAADLDLNAQLQALQCNHLQWFEVEGAVKGANQGYFGVHT